MGGLCSTHGRDEKCMQNLIGEPDRKTPRGRPRCRYEDNIRTDFREIGWEGVE
jgi:hypothetical protein